jgi:competence protein ComEC
LRKRVWLLAAILILAISIIAGCGGTKPQQRPSDGLTIKVLDVGQADAILLQAGGKTTLIDTGDVPTRDRLVNYLRQQGITVIDNLIITHPHADHLGGAAAIFTNFTVKQIYDSGQTTTTALYRQYLTTVKKQGIPFTLVKSGMKIEVGNGAVLDVLAPEKQLITGTNADLNNNSIVAKLIYGDFSMLLAGDAEQESEQQMLAKYKAELKSNILKSPHHGSRTSSSAAFLKAVAPATAIISVGANNDYHHPHESTLKKYAAASIKVYRTDKDGTITITTNGKTYNITKEK